MMRAIGAILITLLISANIAAEPLLFANANVIAVGNQGLLNKQDILIADGRIVSISPAGSVDRPARVTVINAEGQFLMPGLAEMHAHIPPSSDRQSMQEVLTLYLSQGITTVRGMLGEPGHLELRKDQASGEVDAPRIYTSGPSINGRSVSSPEQAVIMVDDQHAAGYDHLKLHPGLSLEEFNALARRAVELKMPFVGHVSADVGAWRAIAAGQTGVDHMDGFIAALVPEESAGFGQSEQFFGFNLVDFADTELIDKLARSLTEGGVWVVPTESLIVRRLNRVTPESLLSEPGMQYVSSQSRLQWQRAKQRLFDDPNHDPEQIARFLALRLRLIQALQRAGVGLLLGSDAPQVFNVPGFSIHEELAIYVRAGLSPAEALATGTVNVARYFGVSDRRGLIKPGFDADLVLLDKNPLTDINHTRSVQGVMVAGRWYDRNWLDAQLSVIEKRYAD